MDAETLERLLIDRGLGGLPRDTGALLAAYLKLEPAATTRARQFDETAELARRAVCAEPLTPPPAFAGRWIRETARSRRRWSLVCSGAALAACVLFGLWLGAAGVRTPTGSPDAAHPVRVVGATVDQEVAEESSPPSAFWSARRWYRRATGGAGDDSVRLLWDSPVGTPRLGGAV